MLVERPAHILIDVRVMRAAVVETEDDLVLKAVDWKRSLTAGQNGQLLGGSEGSKNKLYLQLRKLEVHFEGL